MGFPGANQGPKTISFDRRNRSPHDMFRKFGGVITPQDVTGILQIDWKNLNLPKIRKNFYKVSYFFHSLF